MLNSDLEKQELTITPVDDTFIEVPNITIKNNTVKIYGRFVKNNTLSNPTNGIIGYLPTEARPQKNIVSPCGLHGEGYVFSSGMIGVTREGYISLVTNGKITNESQVNVLMVYDL